MTQGDLAHRRAADDGAHVARIQRAARPGDAESTWSLVSGAITDVADLASTELQLAKLGLKDAKQEVVRRAPALAAGGVMMLIAAVFSVIALARALELVVPSWAAALLAAVAAAGIGGIGLWIGVRRGKPVALMSAASSDDAARLTSAASSDDAARMNAPVTNE